VLGGLYAKATPYPCEVKHKTLNQARAAHGRIGHHQRERKGQAVPRGGKNFLRWRIRPIARKLGIADRLVTFQVMRRTWEPTCSSTGR
jgi:hypothetical protein